ncbi:unnamed protein product [Rhizophagus irregularis]|uniref:Uncharacterized protein n=1 Tax=Rhizophagus irregularis TaxID=588596 RepID=A0A916EES6_9GLOM|nr:unnamed protein product [Rhizophagus irregularis]CAB5093136.1 unnamed protein product [Rhizophagus irregularis]CAB5382144.1 unnamed protein product [Rhizophagus irregularis]
MVLSQIILNCWKKTGIFSPNNEDTFDDDLIFNNLNDKDKELEKSIVLFPEGNLNAQEYIHIKDKMSEEKLTDDEIIDAILNANKEEKPIADGIDEIIPVLEKISPVEAKKTIDKIIRFLYEQEVEFGKVSDELKILKKLQR